MKPEAGKCPKCGTENLKYARKLNHDIGAIGYSFTCAKCKTKGIEWYTLEYSDSEIKEAEAK